MKKLIAITTAAVLFVCLSAVSATAGAARRHTIEGIAIGTGIALLGAAIYNDIHRDDPPKHSPGYSKHNRRRDHKDLHTSYKKDHRRSHHRRLNHRSRGHWEIEKVWVAPVYKKRWNPGHYNRRGVWISGGYQRFLIREGYYQKEKVWVRH